MLEHFSLQLKRTFILARINDWLPRTHCAGIAAQFTRGLRVLTDESGQYLVFQFTTNGKHFTKS